MLNKVIAFLGQFTKSGNDACVTPVRLEKVVGGFKPGDAYCATVIAVRESGVNVRMPADKGSGMVSTRCWGAGAARAQALAKVKVGDRLDVIVKSYDRNTMTLSLVLKGFERLLKPVAKPAARPAKKRRPEAAKMAVPVRSHDVARKPSYHPLAKGTTLLLDTANLIGKLGPEHAAARLAAIVSTLEERGYKALLFWEYRSLGWTLGHQVSIGDAAALEEFAHGKDVSLVREESDLALLQAAQALPDSIIVTGDRLADYADAFPGIVATSRHRSFSVVRVDGRALLTIYGLKDAIVITDPVAAEPEGATEAESAEWALEVDEEVLQRRAERPQVESCRHGLRAWPTAVSIMVTCNAHWRFSVAWRGSFRRFTARWPISLSMMRRHPTMSVSRPVTTVLPTALRRPSASALAASAACTRNIAVASGSPPCGLRRLDESTRSPSCCGFPTIMSASCGTWCSARENRTKEDRNGDQV